MKHSKNGGGTHALGGALMCKKIIDLYSQVPNCWRVRMSGGVRMSGMLETLEEFDKWGRGDISRGSRGNVLKSRIILL